MSIVKLENSKEVIMSWFETEDNDYKKAQILAYIQDQSIPFEDRKEVWLKTPLHLGTEEPYILHLDEFQEKYGEISWFDHFYCDRRQTVHLSDCVDGYSSFFDNEAGEYDNQKADDFINACMNRGVHSFVLDW